MRNVIRQVLFSNRFDTFDADVLAYLAAVEAQDGQVLEPAVRSAYSTLILGLKSDGTLSLINACCVMAGARTLAGALVPLKGTAPTNYNFVSGDYNRKTGLIGNGSSKYLDSNNTNNADSQNNAHIAVYATALGATTATPKIIIGRQINGTNERCLLVASGINDGNLSTRVHSRAAFASHGQPRAVGFVGASRLSSSTISIRNNGSTVSVAQGSSAPSSLTLFVFAGGEDNTAINYDDSRLALYSIGAGLTVPQLLSFDTRLTTFMNTLNTIL